MACQILALPTAQIRRRWRRKFHAAGAYRETATCRCRLVSQMSCEYLMTVGIDDRRQHRGIIVAVVSGIGPVRAVLQEPQNRRDRQCNAPAPQITLDDPRRHRAAIEIAGLLYAARELLYLFALMPLLGFMIAPATLVAAVIFVIAAVPAFHKMPSAAHVADRQIAATACRALAAPSASFVTAIERAGDLGRAHNGALLFNTFCADLRTFCAGRRATAGAAAGVPAAASIQSKIAWEKRS